MRAVIQRVSSAQVTSQGELLGKISSGLLVLLAIAEEDQSSDLNWLERKVLNLRIFPDQDGRMNLSLCDVGGQVLVVSQFTLYGDCRKGNRPSYTRSAPPEKARKLYEAFVHDLQARGVQVESGRFQSLMQVSLVNDGPVTLILDSRKRQI